MADPLSITASLLAVITAAAQSTRSLCDTIKRFQDRSKTLKRLQDELEDLTNILNSLMEAISSETEMTVLLKGPIDRCSQVCRDFEESMKAFSGKCKPGFRDWTRLEFMKGNINDFIDTLAEYKSTISVGLGTITLHTAKISNQVLQEYNEMIKDTVYNLELRMRRIDDKMGQDLFNHDDAPDISVDLKDERAVTQQCIRVCKNARSYIESLISRESSLLPQLFRDTAEDVSRSFEAQQKTRQALDENQNHFSELISQLQTRLHSLVLAAEPNDGERLRLQKDIDISRQCLEICNTAREVSRQKVYRVGEVVADGESDQVVVTTLADLFDVKKALSKGNSAQLIGSMTPENLQTLTEERYKSRFGAVVGSSDYTKVNSTSTASGSESQNSRGQEEPFSGLQARQKPSSNEIRKRAMGGDGF